MKKISELPWIMIAILCLTIGLAPFSPPHIYEKLQMLFSGQLSRPIDWFDLLLHGSPWVLALIKAGLTFKK
ncbi:MAG: RND transporter [Deltaproteobacteria bacterium]|nr:RND transporter [Deltaproteobacteria bacterium]